MLELMKLLLGISTTDTSLDEILNIFITKATAIIMGYCNVDIIPENYNNVIAQYAVYLYKNRDSEGLTQKTEGEKSVVYEGAIPQSIKLQLPLPRVKVIG
jgi:hypothetical protein